MCGTCFGCVGGNRNRRRLGPAIFVALYLVKKEISFN